MSSRIQPEPPFLGETQDVVKQQRDDQNDVFMDEPVGVVAWVRICSRAVLPAPCTQRLRAPRAPATPAVHKQRCRRRSVGAAPRR